MSGYSHWKWSIFVTLSGGVPFGSYYTWYILRNVSLIQLESCVNFGCPFDSNVDIASATMFLAPGMYWISGPYYSSFNLNSNTLSILKFLQVMFLWSLYTLSCWANKIVRNSFSVSTMISISFFRYSVSSTRTCKIPSVKSDWFSFLDNHFAKVISAWICIFIKVFIKIWLY